MKRHRVIVLSLVLLSLLHPVLFAVADPAWYDIEFTQGSWLASNTHNIPWGGENLYVGHVDANKTMNDPNYDKYLTLHITSPKIGRASCRERV